MYSVLSQLDKNRLIAYTKTLTFRGTPRSDDGIRRCFDNTKAHDDILQHFFTVSRDASRIGFLKVSLPCVCLFAMFQLVCVCVSIKIAITKLICMKI